VQDAPSVLGWQRWREFDELHVLGLLKAALEASAETIALPADLIDHFAHILLATLNEIALLTAGAPDKDAAIRSGQAAFDEFFRRLFQTG
jgi:hypothetical protein